MDGAEFAERRKKAGYSTRMYAACAIGVAKDTVYTWVTSKGMPGHKVGRFWKFKKEDVDGWVRDGGAAASSDDFENREEPNG